MTDSASPSKVPAAELGRIGRVLELVGGAMILAMMVVTTIDVVGRYFFSKPLWGGFETTEILMGLVIFAGMPLATARREHITIDLFDAYLGLRARCWQAAIGDIVCAGASAVLAWRMWLRGGQLLSVGETTLQLGVPRGLIACAMAVLMAAAALVFVVAAAVALRAALRAGRA
ncbi:MAG: TRAP transporter small permease [Alphaproteobacteria bacterium]|nr:TRAP transporter small permease [Alphaproteobacteria bacterium]